MNQQQSRPMFQYTSPLLSLCLAALLFFVGQNAAVACLWDSDTPREEAENNPEAYKAVIGWFNRYPKAYYQARLERVRKTVETNPTDLALYDDAGVACDRLGDSTAAIGWMEKKKQQLDKLDKTSPLYKEHQYRYLANLGTFYAHRWIGSGADRNAMSDMTVGRELIAQAIALNPDAHFGRERVQLQAMDWIISPPVPPEGHVQSMMRNEKAVDYVDIMGYLIANLSDDQHQPLSPRKVASDFKADATGLAGLIILGNAWESFDVHYALALSLIGSSDSWLEPLAWARVRELAQKESRVSLHPLVTNQDQAQALIPDKLLFIQGKREHISTESKQMMSAWYPQAKAATAERNQAWETYLTTRLDQGKHPDTDPDFWKQWREPRLPYPPMTMALGERGFRERYYFVIFGTIAVAGIVLIVFLKVRSRRKAAGSADTQNTP
jgi:hypothetical protein